MEIIIILVLFGALTIIMVKASGECIFPQLETNQELVSNSSRYFRKNTKLYYKCRDGNHFSDGNLEHKIQCNNGRWEPLPLQKCVDSCGGRCKNSNQCQKGKCECGCGNYGGVFCKEPRCKVPETPEHGKFVVTKDGQKITVTNQDCRQVEAGVRLSFSCYDGYSITTGSSELVCKGDQWSDNIPKCELVLCREKPLINHGSYYPVFEMYRPGINVTFECSSKYTLNGSPNVKCNDEGNWSDRWPTCVPKKCKRINLEHGDTTKTDDYPNINSRVSFTCKRNYFLVDGPNEISCRMFSTVRWSATLPMCITLEQFSRRCKEQGKIVNLQSKKCVALANTESNGEQCNGTGKPLVIVIAIAGSLLFLLLLVIAVVACQRRRMNDSRRGSGRHGRRRLSNGDDHLFVYYSNDVHVVLPSYDEAMQGRRLNIPPPYTRENLQNRTEPTVTASAPVTANTSRTATDDVPYTSPVQQHQLPNRPTNSNSHDNPLFEDDNLYESIEDIREDASNNNDNNIFNVDGTASITETSSSRNTFPAIDNAGAQASGSAEARNSDIDNLLVTDDFTKYDGDPDEMIYAKVQRGPQGEIIITDEITATGSSLVPPLEESEEEGHSSLEDVTTKYGEEPYMKAYLEINDNTSDNDSSDDDRNTTHSDKARLLQ